jgi:serine/threonine-protein kinase HipA
VQYGDTHLKNFGVLYDDPNGSVNLSPAFDIVSTTAYIRKDLAALTLGGSKKWWKLQQLENFGQSHCGLKPAETPEVLRRLAQALTGEASEKSAGCWISNSSHSFNCCWR